ncbi:MAG: Do family serine endopeptidase [Candidatus Cloacimonadota bacterium]|nr:Do family serine endopeptidase [Candidatus Cloacimonadota bacterium]
MQKKMILLMLATFISISIFSIYPTNSDGKSPFVQVVKEKRESVVHIRVEAEQKNQYGKNPFQDDIFKYFFPQVPQTRKFVGMGSGFVFKKDKNEVFIMTNYHVVERAKNDGEITVTLADKDKYEAEIVGLDPKTDLAVIKIHVQENEKIIVANFGDSDKIDVGEWVIAIGNPFGELSLERTVTVGVISAKNRSDLNFGTDSPIYQDYLQTDAAINPGNSGGPLMDIQGNIVGVNAAISSPAGGNVGIGFAIPSNIAKNVSENLVKTGKVARAYLGILPQELTSDLATGLNLKHISGVLVAKVESDTPAEKCGLQKGDVIIEFDNQRIKNVSHFRLTVSTASLKQKIPIEIVRNGKNKELKVTLEEFPEKGLVNKTNRDNILKIEVVDIDSELAQKLKYDEKYGVIVSKIREKSPLRKSALQEGDLILEIDRKKIDNVIDFENELSNIEDKNIVFFYIKTKSGAYQYIAINLR